MARRSAKVVSSRKAPSAHQQIPDAAAEAAEAIRGLGGEAEAPESSELRARHFLGREMLTWLLWRCETEGPEMTLPEVGPVRVRFGERVVMRALAGEIAECSYKGMDPASAVELRYALGRGSTVHEAQIFVTKGEREWQVGLTAQDLDMRGVKLPEVLSNEEDDRLSERLYLIEELDDIITQLYGVFLSLRLGPDWGKQVMPAMQRWVGDGLRHAAGRLR